MAKDLKAFSFSEIGSEVESRLGFKPDANLYGGLCLANLIDVKLTQVEISATTENGTPSMWDMAGKTSYNLTISYKQKTNEDRFIDLKESIISTKKSTGESIEPKTWNDMIKNQFGRLQHIVNVLDKIDGKKSPLPTDKLAPAYDDAPETRIAKTKQLFEHYERVIKGKGETPRYSGVTLWLKVIAKVPEGTYYTIPQFVGKGFMELYHTNVAPVLEFGASESIELKKKKDKEDKGANLSKGEEVQNSNKPVESQEDILKRLLHNG